MREWNPAGEEPPGGQCHAALTPDQKGLTVLGAPLGSAAHVWRRLALKYEEDDILFAANTGNPPYLES